MRPQANTKHGNIFSHRIAKQFLFVRQIRMALDFVDIHGATKNNEAVISLKRGLRGRCTTKIHITDPKTVAAKERVERSQRFTPNMLTDEQFLHTLIL